MPRQVFAALATVFFAAPVVVATGCTTSPGERAAAGSVTPSTARDPKVAVAKVGGEAIIEAELKEHAKAIGLTTDRFVKGLDSGEKSKIVDASKKAGEEAGVSGTPAFFINGRPLSGAQPFERFKEIIDHELRGSGS